MSSTFLRLTDYCIAEYIPTPVTSVPGGKVLTTDFYKLVNNNKTLAGMGASCLI
jgi:hypothetical protein